MKTATPSHPRCVFHYGISFGRKKHQSSPFRSQPLISKSILCNRKRQTTLNPEIINLTQCRIAYMQVSIPRPKPVPSVFIFINKPHRIVPVRISSRRGIEDIKRIISQRYFTDPPNSVPTHISPDLSSVTQSR